MAFTHSQTQSSATARSGDALHTSRAISLARITLVVGLVFLHYGSFPNSQATPFEGMDTGAHRLATWANSAILFFFFSAVPLLSMISGWLFFSFKPEEAWPTISKRISRRFTSLYMPLVVWNMAYMAVLYALFVMHPNMAFFTHSNRITFNFATAETSDYINAIFAVTNEPVAFQFWFVRDLFVTCLISPILWLMLRYAPLTGAAALACVWLSGATLGIFLRLDVPFFFYLGALIQQKRLPLAISSRWAIRLAALYIALSCMRAMSSYMVPQGELEPFWLETATRLMRLAGVLGCWGMLYHFAFTRLGKVVSNYGGLAFFLHSAHWPLLAVVKVALWRIMPAESGAWMMLHFFLSVMVTVGIGLAAGIVLAKRLPQVFALMNGGRLLGQVKARFDAPVPPAEPSDTAIPFPAPVAAPVVAEAVASAV